MVAEFILKHNTTNMIYNAEKSSGMNECEHATRGQRYFPSEMSCQIKPTSIINIIRGPAAVSLSSAYLNPFQQANTAKYRLLDLTL